MKKLFLALAVVAALCTGALTACGGSSDAPAPADDAQQADKVSVVCTVFPAYDWARQVVGENDAVDITYLLGEGVDLHSYQPSVQDIAKIADCDVFVHVGGESDEWVVDALKEATNKDMQVVNMLQAVGDKAVEEEVVEGMEGEAEEEGEEEEGPEYDEHVWLSLKNAQLLVDAIADALQQADAANAESYAANADSYKAQLAELDAAYADAVNGAKVKTVLFADRFPFRYMVDDYGLSYYAAFVGCSAETEASFETVSFLAKKVDELGLKTVLIIESSDKRIAETVIENTQSKDAEIAVMDSLQSTTNEQVEGGRTYLAAMQANLDVLKKALA